MKKSILVITMMLVAFTAQAQDKEKFLNEFKTFVTSFAAMENPTATQLDSIKIKYDRFRREYPQIYKPLFSNEEIKEYNEYKGKYTKQIASFYGNKTIDAIDSTATRVGKSVKRTSSQVSGFMKGLFKKDKKK